MAGPTKPKPQCAAVADGDVFGADAPEIFAIKTHATGSLKHAPYGKHVALLPDARFSGVSTGACIGHIGPEGLAGGPIGEVLDGDDIRIQLDCHRLESAWIWSVRVAAALRLRKAQSWWRAGPPRPDMAPHAALPDDTRRWAALQQAGGGTWGGCVYDTDAAIVALRRKG